MKHLKKILTALLLGFLAFAPPGTLIFIAVLILSFFGKTWFIVGVVAGSVALTVYGFIYRKKLLQMNFVKNIRRKFNF